MCRGADWTDYKDKGIRGLGGYSLQFIGHNILRFKVTGKKRPFIILIDVQL